MTTERGSGLGARRQAYALRTRGSHLSAAVVWSASYLPFGGVLTSTGTPTALLRTPTVPG